MQNIETREIEVSRYVEGFRDAPRFLEYCKQCRNFGRLWTCPPFNFDAEEVLLRWKNALFIASRFDLPASSDGISVIRQKRVELERRLLELEGEYGGLAFGFSGECLHCAECTRGCGLKCRHPELVRPALEAYGFDVCTTMTDLFGYELEWAPKGQLPSRITLVGALFHNNEQGIIKF